MGLLDIFKLEKLKIYSYEDAKRIKHDDVFEVMFNPESYSLSYENVYDPKQGINTTGSPAHYSISKPAQLSLKIIFDGTGVNTYGWTNLREGRTAVEAHVEAFLEQTTNMDGNLHQPKFLTLAWGNFFFKCRLASVNVHYTLFDNSGLPLRAELDTRFFADTYIPERLKKENKKSPDLTHYRIVNAGDQLPLLCEQIYGSPQYYIHVARANNLPDFRNLQPGQEIFFPPIEK